MERMVPQPRCPPRSRPPAFGRARRTAYQAPGDPKQAAAAGLVPGDLSSVVLAVGGGHPPSRYDPLNLERRRPLAAGHLASWPTGLDSRHGTNVRTFGPRHARHSGVPTMTPPEPALLRRARRRRHVFPQAAVQHEVMPASGAELGTADHPFSLEACLRERPLLGHVLDVRRRLDSVHVTTVEQLLDKQSLS